MKHVKYADAARRLPGILLNWDYGLALRFQVNPEELTFTKDPKYAQQDIPGWRAPQRWWTGGGEASIRFELFFDSSNAGHSGGTNLFSPPLTRTPVLSRQAQSVLGDIGSISIGLQGILATVNSFTKPKSPLDRAKLGPALKQLVGSLKSARSVTELGSAVGSAGRSLGEVARPAFNQPEEFLPPPEAYFVYGTRIWRVHVLAAAIVEKAHDRWLNPTQAIVQFTLGIIEEGAVHRFMQDAETGLALLSSSATTAGSALRAWSDLGLFPSIIGDLLS